MGAGKCQTISDRLEVLHGAKSQAFPPFFFKSLLPFKDRDLKRFEKVFYILLKGLVVSL